MSVLNYGRVVRKKMEIGLCKLHLISTLKNNINLPRKAQNPTCVRRYISLKGGLQRFQYT